MLQECPTIFLAIKNVNYKIDNSNKYKTCARKQWVHSLAMFVDR